MQKLEIYIDRVFTYLVPLCLCSSGFLNLLQLYFNWTGNDLIRRCFSWGIIILLFLVCIAKGVFFIKSKQISKKTKGLLVFPVILYVLCYAVTLIKTGMELYILKSFLSGVLYILPAYITAIITFYHKNEDKFCSVFRWYGLILSPVILFYTIRILTADKLIEDINKIGVIDYLTIAATCFILLSYIIINQTIESQKIMVTNRKPKQTFDTFLAVLYTAAILESGCRSYILCVGVLLFCFAIYWMTSKSIVVKTFRYVVLGIIFECIVLTICFVPVNSGMKRFQALFSDIFGGNMKSSICEDTGASKNLRELINQIENINSVESVNELLMKTEHNSNARIYLYAVAIKDIKNHPLTGLGPVGYQSQYGICPHNVILELFVDFGLIIGTVVIVFVLLLLIHLLRLRRMVKSLPILLLFFISFVPNYVFGGDLYNTVSIWMILGITVSILLFRDSRKIQVPGV